MTFDYLVDVLRDMYAKGKHNREATVALTLFGIRYAPEIRALGVRSVAAAVDDLLRNANISPKLETKIRLGMQLSAYVEYRQDAYPKWSGG